VPRRATAVLGTVAVAAVLNYMLSGFLGDLAFNVGRVVIAVLGGWFMVSAARRNLWMAMAVGPVVLVVDHVILKGGHFVLAHYLWPQALEGQALLAAGGVLISFVMFVPMAALCSWSGGFAARRKNQRVEAHS
jgi:hypothetical protein